MKFLLMALEEIPKSYFSQSNSIPHSYVLSNAHLVFPKKKKINHRNICLVGGIH